MKRRKLSTQQIETFRAVMLFGTVNAAANELGLSQPALTRMLRRTEDIVGYKLFELVRNRLIPTTEARMLFRHVAYISDQLDALDEAVSRIRDGGRGSFRFAASVNLARSLIPDVLVSFGARFAHVPVHLDTLQLPNVVDYLVLGTGECFISIVPTQHSAVHARAIKPAPLVCVMQAHHPLADRQAILPADLNAFPRIQVDPDRWYGAQVELALKTAGLDRVPDFTVRGAESVIDLCARGLGIGVIDALSAVRVEPYGLVARALPLQTPFWLHIQTYRDQPISSYVREVESLLMDTPGVSGSNSSADH